jgi:hypothetical protein
LEIKGGEHRAEIKATAKALKNRLIAYANNSKCFIVPTREPFCKCKWSLNCNIAFEVPYLYEVTLGWEQIGMISEMEYIKSNTCKFY